jgi:membrane dipeptidase
MDTSCRNTIAYAQNIRAMVDVVGVDHVCIGTDTKMAKPYLSNNETSDTKINERVGERTNIAWQNQKKAFTTPLLM